MKYRPAIPDNIKNWKVFQDDKEIERFLKVVDEFSVAEIDLENLNLKSEDQQSSFVNEVDGHKILELKTNHILKGLVPLERLFSNNDVPVNLLGQKEESEVIDVNIGTTDHPKIVKLSRALSDE